MTMATSGYVFSESEHEVSYEARFWNSTGTQIAIVAVVTKRIDWAAYIGAGNSPTEGETCEHAAGYGCRLSEKDARHFFPHIELPYRN